MNELSNGKHWVRDQRPGSAWRPGCERARDSAEAGERAPGKTGTVRETVEYFEFGAPFYVYVPQKPETVDFVDVLGCLDSSSVV